MQSFRGGWGKLAWGVFALAACSLGQCAPAAELKPANDPRLQRRSGGRCAPDQTREFYCEELLPVGSSLSAPAPYESCPAAVEPPSGDWGTALSGRFDQAYTKFIRSRVPPGHACCYSWCAPLEVRAASDAPPPGTCEFRLALPETYCVLEPEGGTSEPAGSPWERCPAALKPPADRAFSVPEAAPLDVTTSSERRGQGLAECCYGWCSRLPEGYQLEKEQR
jgi:hypothetical protein